MYEQIVKIRVFEEHVNELYTTGKMTRVAHHSIGQEAIAGGQCAKLRPRCDSTINRGVRCEVMNMASLWNLPVNDVCENTLYNEYSANTGTTAGSMSARATALGIPTEEVDGQDVRAVYAATLKAVEQARRGEGPTFLLCNTYRYHGHHVGDISRSYYRSKDEEEHWKTERDPLLILAQWLTEQKLADTSTFEQIEQRVRAEVESGVAFGLNASFPDPSEV